MNNTTQFNMPSWSWALYCALLDCVGNYKVYCLESLNLKNRPCNFSKTFDYKSYKITSVFILNSYLNYEHLKKQSNKSIISGLEVTDTGIFLTSSPEILKKKKQFH